MGAINDWKRNGILKKSEVLYIKFVCCFRKKASLLFAKIFSRKLNFQMQLP